MELIGIGFVVLCYYFGKSEYLKACTQRELAVIALLPEAERQAKVEELLTRRRKKQAGDGVIH